MPCFYAPLFIETDEFAVLEGEEFHHAVHVFRKQVSEEIFITNGMGLLAQASITGIHKKQLIAKILSLEKKTKSFPKLALAFALLKNKHDHLLIEKTTELGVAEFFPYTCTRSVRKPSGNTVEKFKKITIAASKQCDNPIFPTISPVLDLQKMVEMVKQKEFSLVAAYEQEERTQLKDLFPEKIQQNMCLIIGPEGGFSESEISYLQENHIPLISLGNHILRAETAAICGISMVAQMCLEKDRNYY